MQYLMPGEESQLFEFCSHHRHRGYCFMLPAPSTMALWLRHSSYTWDIPCSIFGGKKIYDGGWITGPTQPHGEGKMSI